MKIVYKVVQNINGKIYSAWMQGEMKFQYELSKINVPAIRNAPFATFDTIEHARQWRQTMFSGFSSCNYEGITPTEIWKCAATQSSVKRSRFLSTAHSMTAAKCRKYWNSNISQMISEYYTDLVPEGTTFCSQLVFLEKVS